jgi:hypothetical protein
MFDNDEDGGKWIPSNWLRIDFTIRYKMKKEDKFPWFYLDYNTPCRMAFANGLQSELILKGNYDYLAKLDLKYIYKMENSTLEHLRYPIGRFIAPASILNI